jgi:PBP1b-binding outer membrane lipoprotein LpoB
MKTIKTHLKAVAYVLTLLILFEGCTVYKSTPVTLKDAYKANTKVEVKTNDNQTQKYDRIEFEDGKYYGVKKPYYRSNYPEHKKLELIKTPIDPNNMEHIKIKDETASKIITFGPPIILFVVGSVALVKAIEDICWICQD